MIILGVLIGVMASAICFLLYDRKRPKHINGMTEEEIKKVKEQNEHYDHMLNYDVAKAYGGVREQ